MSDVSLLLVSLTHTPVIKAEELMKEYIGKPDSEFRVDMVEDALVDGKRKNQITEKEYDVIAKKKGEDKLLAAYNVLRIHG